MNDFKAAVNSFYANYANFGGRASIGQFWWVQLYLFIVCAVLEALAAWCDHGFFYYFFMCLLWLFSLINLVPLLAVTWRRLHDTGRGGGWFFIGLIPIIGNIWLFILLLLPGNLGANRFGNPS